MQTINPDEYDHYYLLIQKEKKKTRQAYLLKADKRYTHKEYQHYILKAYQTIINEEAENYYYQQCYQNNNITSNHLKKVYNILGSADYPFEKIVDMKKWTITLESDYQFTINYFLICDDKEEYTMDDLFIRENLSRPNRRCTFNCSKLLSGRAWGNGCVQEDRRLWCK